MLDFDAGTSSKMCKIMVFAVVGILELAVPTSDAIDVRAVVITNLLLGAVIGVGPGTGISELADVDVEIYAATMSALESIPMLE